MLHNRWDEVIAHELVRCEACGEIVHTVLLKEGLDSKVREMAEPLCARHKAERQAGMQAGRPRPARGVAS
jgi:hypothetical protein